MEDLETLCAEMQALLRGFMEYAVAFGLELGVRPKREKARFLSILERRSVNGASENGHTWQTPNGTGHHAGALNGARLVPQVGCRYGPVDGYICRYQNPRQPGPQQAVTWRT
jgi:hypothetical protein